MFIHVLPWMGDKDWYAAFRPCFLWGLTYQHGGTNIETEMFSWRWKLQGVQPVRFPCLLSRSRPSALAGCISHLTLRWFVETMSPWCFACLLFRSEKVHIILDRVCRIVHSETIFPVRETSTSYMINWPKWKIASHSKTEKERERKVICYQPLFIVMFFGLRNPIGNLDIIESWLSISHPMLSPQPSRCFSPIPLNL